MNIPSLNKLRYCCRLWGRLCGLLCALVLAHPMHASEAAQGNGKVYLLLFAGQSNAGGWGYQQYLLDRNDRLAQPQEDIDLYYTVAGEGYLPENTLIGLQAGTSNKVAKPGGYYPDLKEPVARFGPELSLARTFRDRLADEDAKVAIVKFAHGGTSLYDIEDWYPDGTADSRNDGKLYRIFQDTAKRAVKALEQKYPGRRVEIVGMGWVQGESDALEGKGPEYEEHLRRLIADVRATFGDQVVFAFSQLSPNQYAYSKDKEWVAGWEQVAAAQAAVGASVPRTRMTPTTGDAYSVAKGFAEGVFHFTTPALLQIGEDLGNAIIELSGLPAIDADLAGEDYTTRIVGQAAARPADGTAHLSATGSANAAGTGTAGAGTAAASVVWIRPGLTGKPYSEGVVEKGQKVFRNRDFVFHEPPAQLKGRPFLVGSIDGVSFTTASAGELLVLTPAPQAHSVSQAELLESRGFEKISGDELYALFGTNRADRVQIYRKRVVAGETFNLRKWAIVVGCKIETAVAASSAQAQVAREPETLYNGIVLPAVWPPRDIPTGNSDPASRAPTAVPYLENRPDVVPIALGRQLFVDDFLIEETDLQRTFHLPEKYEGNPVLKPQTPREMGLQNNLAATVLKSGGVWWEPDEQQFKLWYEAGWFGGIALATSTDGLHWERPDLGAASAQRAANEVTPAGLRPDSWTVTRDWDTQDPNARYKLFARRPGGSHAMGAYTYVSPDGITWSDFTESGPMGDRSTAYYNPFRKKWVFGLRSFFSGRSRHYWEGSDFMTDNQWHWDEDDFWREGRWEPGKPVVWAAADRLDPRDPQLDYVPQLYNIDAVPYESIMLGMFAIWLGPHNNETNGMPKITDLNFAYSRDGFHWDRPDRRPAIAASREPGTWDRGYLQSAGSVCVVMGDQLWFYYSGFAGDETRPRDGLYADGATGVAVLRRDGFASMDAGKRTGSLTTRPVVFDGAELFINAQTSGSGSLRAEVRELDGTPIMPFTLANSISFSGDKTLAQMSWKGGKSLADLDGRPVRLHFELEDGSLYSFWVSKDASGRSDGYVAGGGPGYTGATDTVGRAALLKN